MSGRHRVTVYASIHDHEDGDECGHSHGVNSTEAIGDRSVDHEPNVFDIRNALEPPTVRLYTISKLNSEH
jgi:hypothetical protein